MRKIVHFILNSPFPNYTGGRETWLYNVATRLADEDYTVHIYTTKNDEYPKSFNIDKSNIKIFRVKTLMSNPFIKEFLRSYLLVFETISFIISIYLCMRRQILKNETVIAMGPLEDSVAGIMLRRSRPIKLVCSLRGFHAAVMTKRLPHLKKLWYSIEKHAIKVADRVWCNGYDTLEYVRKGGFEAVMMPNGVDVGHFVSDSIKWEPGKEKDKDLFADEKKTYVVSTATLLPIKGMSKLIEAVSILKERGLNEYRIIWVGKGDPIPYIEEARRRGIENKIEFIGERTDMAPYLRAANIVVCLSGGGGLSMAALEGMAAGKNIIAWDSGVYRQLLHHLKSALLIEENNSIALADAMEEITNNQALYSSMGNEARKAVLSYDWSNVLNKFKKEINSL